MLKCPLLLAAISDAQIAWQIKVHPKAPRPNRFAVSASTSSSASLARAEWARSTKPSIPSSIATSPVKDLPAHLGRDEDFVTRFRVEAKSAARHNHPNIVTIFSVGQDRGTHFMAMELVPGEDLADRVHKQRRIPEAQAVALMIQAIHGLDHAWQHGIVHRDLKPSNLMVNSQGILKILDFGVARCTSEMATRMTMTGSGVGTPRYMPPEQARNAKDVDLRADIYSLARPSIT